MKPSTPLSLPEIQALAKAPWGTRMPRLATLAATITALFPAYEAKMENWWGSFDREVGQLRSPGRFRQCKALRVYPAGKAAGRPIFSHNPLEAYRSNDEVVRWIAAEAKKARL